MSSVRIAFVMLSAVLSLVGLFSAAAARDAGFAIFAWSLLGFGAAFALFLIKRHYDELEAR